MRGDHPEPHHRGRGGRGRLRVRELLLAALLEGPAHGYELIRRLEDRSDGHWRPSPGSVYPNLQVLQEEGLVTVEHQEEGRRVYALSATGRQRADRQQLDVLRGRDEPGSLPRRELRNELDRLELAARQVASTGAVGDLQRAAEIVRDARQRLYRLLAGD